MSDRQQVEAIVEQFYTAINADDTSGLPLAENAEYSGVLTPEPVSGEAKVRQYLQEIAPFLTNMRSTRMIIENGTVASVTQYEVVNGVPVEGVYIFEVENDKIRRIRAVFDTRSVFAGSSAT